MRMTVVTLALCALAVSTAIAQVPRTINYQGRIADGSTPVAGNRTMTLRLYTSATGGTPIFSETQTVEFSNGVFTVAIGGGTSGGIPESVAFDGQYWLGVSISGFNSGNEIAPRFVLRSSPYSFRARIADSADHAMGAITAQSAASLDVPATLGGGATTQPTVTLTNTQGPGLHVSGGNYAIISDGVDSTSRYFVAGSKAGSKAAPVAGAYYRDNVPIAWATVNGDGTIISDFGVSQVGKPGDRGYEVMLDHPVATIEFNGAQVPEFSAVIVPGGGIPPIVDPMRVFASWTYKQDASGIDPQTIIVRIIDIQGTAVQMPFSITVFGRPQ